MKLAPIMAALSLLGLSAQGKAASVPQQLVQSFAVAARPIPKVVSEIPDGLIGWWKLTEGTGTTAYDSSGGGVNGTITFGAGSWNGGLIDWQNTWIDFGNTNKFDFPGNVTNCTWSIWFYTSSAPTCLWKRGLYNTGGYYLEFLTSHRIGVTTKVTEGLAAWTTPNNTWTDNTWQLVTFAKEARKFRIFLNNTCVLYYDSAWANGPITSTESLTLGRYAAGSELFAGKARDFRIYNRALSTNEVQTLYSNGPQ